MGLWWAIPNWYNHDWGTISGGFCCQDTINVVVSKPSWEFHHYRNWTILDKLVIWILKSQYSPSYSVYALPGNSQVGFLWRNINEQVFQKFPSVNNNALLQLRAPSNESKKRRFSLQIKSFRGSAASGWKYNLETCNSLISLWRQMTWCGRARGHGI